MANNCSNNTSNSCTPCTGCETTIPTSCVIADFNISCIDMTEGDNLSSVLQALGNAVCNFYEVAESIQQNAWNLDGNTVNSEKFIGTIDNFAFPVRVNNTEIWAFETDGSITRNTNLFSVPYSLLHTSWGYRALANNNTNVSGNCAFGGSALAANTTGYENNGFGYGALLANTTGRFNNAFGRYALASLNGGSYNTAIGSNAGAALASSSNYHTFLGGTSGYTQTGGTGTTYIGFETNGTSGTLSFSIALGYKAQLTADNQLAIGSASDGAYITQWQNYYSASGVHASYFRTSTPEAAQTGTRGSIAFVDDTTNGEGYLKTTGTGNTGWGQILASTAVTVETIVPNRTLTIRYQGVTYKLAAVLVP